jgi:hypothetical protein
MKEVDILFLVLDVASHLPSCRVELSFPIGLLEINGIRAYKG